MNVLRLAWRQLRRDLAAGEVRILLGALILSVMAVASVGLLTERAERALTLEANRLLGGDAVLRADAPITEVPRERARALGLQQTETVQFPSMIRAGESLRLGEVRAMAPGFPLRGEFRLVAEGSGDRPADGIPAAGTVWLSRAGAEALGVKPGDLLGIGASQLRLAALVAQEPDAALDYFNIAPRLFINLADLPATGLVQEGARVGYRLVVAGDAAAVQQWIVSAKSGLQRGQRLETSADGRPEIRRALAQAGRFLGLAALVSVVLSAIAVAMAARRHAARHLQGAAVLRCLGASQARLAAVMLGELLMLGLAGTGTGALLAYGLQALVGAWLAQKLGLDLPAAGLMPALEGIAMGMTVLMTFAAPPVLALRRVPALRVLRRDLDPTEPSAWVVALLGLAGLAILLWWRAGSPALASAMLGGVGLTLLALGGLALLLIGVLRRFRGRLRGPWRYGLANISRRPATSVAQIAALGLGVMALLLLGFVRSELLDRWRNALPDDAPNRFLANVQRDQIAPLQALFHAQRLTPPELYAMVRGRWSARNGEAVKADAKPAEGERSRRLAEREFNLSTMATLRADNRVVEGKFWSGAPAEAELSVEVDFARTLGWKLGDRITFDITGQVLEARITSLREVEWESFRPNFFVLVSPSALDAYPASHVGAFHIAKGKDRVSAPLLAAMPNLSVIDVDAILDQVRRTVSQVTAVVEAVFLFSLAAGVLVLMAAVSASQDERLREGGVMRVLGASTRQLRGAQASEFLVIGLLAGLIAAIAATLLTGVIAAEVFNLPWKADWGMAASGAVIGTLAALAAGLFATRKIVRVPPATTLRELDA